MRLISSKESQWVSGGELGIAVVTPLDGLSEMDSPFAAGFTTGANLIIGTVGIIGGIVLSPVVAIYRGTGSVVSATYHGISAVGSGLSHGVQNGYHWVRGSNKD